MPYPGKRPFPNALDPCDGKSGEASAWDFDGDGLKSYEEYRAWRRTGRRVQCRGRRRRRRCLLGYSDGTKTSRPGEVPGAGLARRALGRSRPWALPEHLQGPCGRRLARRRARR